MRGHKQHFEAFLPLVAWTLIYIHEGIRGQLSLDNCHGLFFTQEGRHALATATWHDISRYIL